MAKYLRLDQRSLLSVFLAATAIALPGAAFAEATVSAIPAAQEEVTVYVQGAIKDRDAKAVANPSDSKLPALPVVYDDEPVPAPVMPAA